MKRIIILILAAALLLSACGSAKPAEPAVTKNDLVLPEETSSEEYAYSLTELYLLDEYSLKDVSSSEKSLRDGSLYISRFDMELSDQKMLEGYADLYRIVYSYKSGGKAESIDAFIALSKGGADSEYLYVLGLKDASAEPDPYMALQDIYWDIVDIDTCLLAEPDGRPAGGGSSDKFFGEKSEEWHFETVLTEWNTVEEEGDFWYQLDYEGLQALCYFSISEGRARTWVVETTRSDFYTWRDIRVGSTREEVLAAYPQDQLYSEAEGTADGDYLMYNRTGESGVGMNLFFYFEDDVVVKLQSMNFID